MTKKILSIFAVLVLTSSVFVFAQREFQTAPANEEQSPLQKLLNYLNINRTNPCARPPQRDGPGFLPRRCNDKNDCGPYEECVGQKPPRGQEPLVKICVLVPQRCSGGNDCQSPNHYCVVSKSGQGYCSANRPPQCKSKQEQDEEEALCKRFCVGARPNKKPKECLIVDDRCYACTSSNICVEKLIERFVCI